MTQEPPSGASLAEWRGYFQSRFDHGKDDVMTYDVFPEPAGTTARAKADQFYEDSVARLYETRERAAIPDHAEAAADALQRIVDKLRGGTSPEDLGRDVELLGRVMARRT